MGWLGTWPKRKAIKRGATWVGSTLTDFSLLLKIASDADLGGELGATPKFAVTTADGTTAANYGRVSYSYSAPNVTANLRTKMTLANSGASGDVIGYLYYGASETDAQNKSATLDSNIVGYWPLEEDPSGSAPQILDWSSNANNGTTTGSMASGDLVAGTVGNGLNFAQSDTDNRVNLPDNGNLFGGLSNLTISCLVKCENNFGDTAYFFNTSAGGASGPYLGRANNVFQARVGNTGTGNGTATDPSTFSYATWYHVAVTYDGTTIRLYVNGSQVATDASFSGTTNNSNGTLYLGNRSTQDRQASAVIDEQFIAIACRSADWVAFDYQNQFNNSSTVTLGAEETIPASGGPFPHYIRRAMEGGMIGMGV